MAKKTEETQEFFMRINNPNTFRRNLLEASKLTLTIVKQTHKVKQIRELKHELISRIAQEVKELKLLVQKAEELMPAHDKAELKKYFPEPITPKEKPIAPSTMADTKVQVRTAHSEIDKISKAIEDIQRKLQNL